jgi:hypothetical protein
MSVAIYVLFENMRGRTVVCLSLPKTDVSLKILKLKIYFYARLYFQLVVGVFRSRLREYAA